MQTLIGILLIAIALANDIYTLRLCWLRVVGGKAPSGIMLLPGLFYAIGAFLIWPDLWTKNATTTMLTLVGAVAFHLLFIVVGCGTIRRFARTR